MFNRDREQLKAFLVVNKDAVLELLHKRLFVRIEADVTSAMQHKWITGLGPKDLDSCSVWVTAKDIERLSMQTLLSRIALIYERHVPEGTPSRYIVSFLNSFPFRSNDARTPPPEYRAVLVGTVKFTHGFGGFHFSPSWEFKQWKLH